MADDPDALDREAKQLAEQAKQKQKQADEARKAKIAEAEAKRIAAEIALSEAIAHDDSNGKMAAENAIREAGQQKSHYSGSSFF